MAYLKKYREQVEAKDYRLFESEEAEADGKAPLIVMPKPKGGAVLRFGEAYDKGDVDGMVEFLAGDQASKLWDLFEDEDYEVMLDVIYDAMLEFGLATPVQLVKGGSAKSRPKVRIERDPRIINRLVLDEGWELAAGKLRAG